MYAFRWFSKLNFFSVLLFFLFTVLLIMVAISGAAIALCLVVILIGCCYLKRYVAIFYDRYRDRVSQKLYP